MAIDWKGWRGGLPTELDVKRLVEKYGVPAEGVLIPHADIAACIGHPWKSVRYRTVIDAWRRKLRKEFNVDTTVEPSLGLYVLTPPERIVIGKRDSRAGLRKFRRGGARVAVTPDDGLTAEQRQEREHAAAVVWRLYSSAARELKALEPPKPVPALPRA